MADTHGGAYDITMSDLALAGAVEWIETLLLGSVATLSAILAIAAIGFLMLSGRIPARRAVATIIGCFILFSAAAIANGLVGSLGPSEPPPPVVSAEPAYVPATPKPTSNDPYAGASVPDQRTKDIFR